MNRQHRQPEAQREFGNKTTDACDRRSEQKMPGKVCEQSGQYAVGNDDVRITDEEKRCLYKKGTDQKYKSGEKEQPFAGMFAAKQYGQRNQKCQEQRNRQSVYGFYGAVDARKIHGQIVEIVIYGEKSPRQRPFKQSVAVVQIPAECAVGIEKMGDAVDAGEKNQY